MDLGCVWPSNIQSSIVPQRNASPCAVGERTRTALRAVDDSRYPTTCRGAKVTDFGNQLHSSRYCVTSIRVRVEIQCVGNQHESSCGPTLLRQRGRTVQQLGY
eukprot:PhF_6_TR25148/c0_g1_i1/m.34643